MMMPFPWALMCGDCPPARGKRRGLTSIAADAQIDFSEECLSLLLSLRRYEHLRGTEMSEGSGMFVFIDKTYFKPTAEGWLFKEPGIWPRRTYRLTDAQKAGLVKPVRWMLVVIFTLTVAILQTRDLLSDSLSFSPWLSLAIAVIAGMIVLWIYVAVFIRPVLSDLTPTDERITFGDQVRMQAAALPKALIIVWLTLFLVVVILGVGMGFVDGWDLEDVGVIAFCAIMSLYPAVLLVIRSRQSNALRQ